MFISLFTLVIDYMIIIWVLNTTKSSISKFDIIYKTTAQAIIERFEILFLQTNWSKSDLLSVSQKIHFHKLRTWIK